MNLKDKIKSVKNSIVSVCLVQGNQVNVIGSGFCIIDKKHIATAAHLFQNLTPEQLNSLSCLVGTKEQNGLVEYSLIKVKLLNRNVANDSAFLEITEEKDNLLSPLNIDYSGDVEEGQEVYFIGFPYAVNLVREGFGITLITNKGIISSVKRTALPPNALDWFIVDAVSNPGNSGCPLVDLDTNKVIGIMSISFAIRSQVNPSLDIKETMHIAGAKPILLSQEMFRI